MDHDGANVVNILTGLFYDPHTLRLDFIPVLAI